MILKKVKKNILIYMSFLFLSGCTYHKAMNQQQERQAVIEKNLSKQKAISIQQTAERNALEQELAVLKQEASDLDVSIRNVKEKIEKAEESQKRDERIQQEKLEKELLSLEVRKIKLREEIAEKMEIIEVL